MKYPVLQVALDFVNLSRALKIAKEAVSGGADWIEAGTPLIKSEGLETVRKLRKLFPDKTIIADMKVMDAGRVEVESAAKAGANIIGVLGAATDATIRECVKAAKNYGAKIIVDLIGVKNPAIRAKEIESLGADYIGVHCAIDEQMEGKVALKELSEIRRAVNIPIAAAGGINSETAHLYVKNGADIIIAGGAITKAVNPRLASSALKKAVSKKIKIKTEFFKRVDADNVKKALGKVSTANVSDAMHRSGDLNGISAVCPGVKMIGKVFTARTYPGDWAKSVQAVDKAEEGSVIVIDAGGVGPAVWGELATHGAIQKKIAGVIINGACRDAAEIRKLKFPLFSKSITPTCGEPKGFGEMDIPVTISGVKVFSGDWAIGDDDGVCIIPSASAAEIVNRAMNVLETENRLRKEIDQGSTLAKVTELLRWEKRS